MPSLKNTAAAAAMLLCAACTTGTPTVAPVAPEPAAPLLGSMWRLQSIQSMDAQGSTRPPDDRVYTVRLHTDGTAAFRLDCNRGNGRYTLMETGPGSGSLSFGQVAMTRMMCTGSTLDTRVAQDMSTMRTFELKGQTLTMSSVANGTIYTWTRDAAAGVVK